VALAAGAATAASYGLFHLVLPPRGAGPLVGMAETFAAALWLMLPVCALSGALFTLLGHSLRAQAEEDARAAGLLTFSNTIGAMLGALLAGFVLLPLLGMERSFFLLALAYFSVKDLAKSEANVRQALQLDPQTRDAYTLLANIAFARGSAEEAKQHLRTAIATHPRSILNYMALVTQYEKEGNWEEAKRLCEKAHEIDPSAPLVAAELAFLYLEHGGDVNTAVSLAQIARQKMPDSPITADALGWAYYKLGSPGPAITQLKVSSEAVPDNPIYRYHLGMAYVAARRFDLAGQSLRSALKTDPNFPYATSARSALEKLPKGVR
jgi:Tfp pilus assembly protein PilF